MQDLGGTPIPAPVQSEPASTTNTDQDVVIYNPRPAKSVSSPLGGGNAVNQTPCPPCSFIAMQFYRTAEKTKEVSTCFVPQSVAGLDLECGLMLSLQETSEQLCSPGGIESLENQVEGGFPDGAETPPLAQQYTRK